MSLEVRETIQELEKETIYRHEQEVKNDKPAVDQVKCKFTKKRFNPNNSYRKPGMKSPNRGCHKCRQMGHWQCDCKKKINQHTQEVVVATCKLQKDSQVKQNFHLRQGKGPEPCQEKGL